MDVQDTHELQEHAEHSAHDRSLIPVTFTMAVLAVLLAATTLLGHRSHTEELLNQNRATDQWAYYQAKNTREHTYEIFMDLLSVSAVNDPAQAAKVKEKYGREAARYKDEEKDINAEAHSLEREVAGAQRKADRYDLGEVFLDAAIVVVSLTLLTRRREFWLLGIAMGVVGFVIVLSGVLLRAVA